MINDELLHKWVNKTISERELEIFKARPEFESLTQLYKQTESLTGPEFDSESMLANILSSEKKTQEPSRSKVKPKSKLIPLWFKLTAAASVLLITGLFLLSPKENIITLNGSDGFAESLPDGTQIELNPNSTLSYDETDFKDARNVNMTGVAFFKVTKGTPFTVESTSGQVQVLGTSFKVSDLQDIFQVNCEEGKVKVESKEINANAILEANERFSVIKNGGSVLVKNNLTQLKAVKLSRAILEIEERFNIDIELKDIDTEQKLTSGFQHDKVENAIKTITLALGVSYEKNENSFIISK